MDSNEKLRNMIKMKFSKLDLDPSMIVSLLTNTSDYVLILNSSRQIVWTSNSFLRDFEYTEQEVAMKTFDKFLHPDDIDTSVQRYNDGLTDSILQPKLFVLRFMSKSREFIPIELNLSKPNIIGEHMMVIARAGELKERKELARKARPSKIMTDFCDGKKGGHMTSSDEWWQIFDAMDIRDIAISSLETVAWQCNLREGERFKDVVLMIWHYHLEQDEKIMPIDGDIIVQVEKKRFWYSWFGINKGTSSPTHYTTHIVRAGNTLDIPRKWRHRVLGTGRSANFTIVWNPKLFL